MSNETYHKYLNIFSANRGYNKTFDGWVKRIFTVEVSTDPWTYGQEFFYDKGTGGLVSEAAVMKKYVKTRQPYFRWFDEVNDFFFGGFKTIEEWWAAKKSA